MYKAKAYSAASATSPLASTTIPRRDPTRTRRADRNPFLRHLPLRSSLGAQRVEQHSCPRSTRSSPAMRSSAGSPRSARPSPSSSRATWRRSAAWSIRTHLPQCRAGLEQFCPNQTLTFNSPDKHLGGVTYGGYSDSIVVDEHFVLRVPANLNLAGAAPLLCAGITTYSPMRRWGVTKGKKVGVVGLGGLGHMGGEVCPCASEPTSSSSPPHPARRRTRSASVPMRSSSPATPTRCRKHAGSFDFILDTVSADHDINAYINLLGRDGNLTLVGAPEKPLAVSAFSLIMRTPQPLRLAHRRHRRDSGDARLLRQAQHHRRCRSHPNPEGQRSLRETAQV